MDVHMRERGASVLRRTVVGVSGAIAYAFGLLLHKVQWWRGNRYNDTWAVNVFTRDKVKVGRFSYGPMEVYEYGAENEGLSIGCLVSIGPGVRFLLGGNHYYEGFTTYPIKARILGSGGEAISRGPIKIEDDVWIGMGAVILSGVTIGKGSVIGACSVVSRDIPPFSIAAGSPALIVKRRFPPEIVESLLALDYSRMDVAALCQIAEFNYRPLTEDTIDLLRRLLQPKAT